MQNRQCGRWYYLNVFNVMFTKDIVLDEEAFKTAADKLQILSGDMQKLKTRIETLLAELRIGFDTPAGEKFFALCGTNLIKPLDDQAHVIEHVAQNLQDAQNSYSSVFVEYQILNTAINNASQ